MRAPPQRLWKGRQYGIGGVEQDDAHLRWVEHAEVALERPARELGDLAGDLDAGRSRPDHRDRQPRIARAFRSLQLGQLERAEDPPAQLERVVDRLHPRSVQAEFIVPEVRLSGAGGDDQAVIADAGAPSNRLERHLARLEVDIDHFAEQHTRVRVAAEDVPGRRGDVTLGEDARRHLVEQRLEQVMVGAVDHGHVHRSTP